MDLVQLAQAINTYYQGYDQPNRHEIEMNLKQLGKWSSPSKEYFLKWEIRPHVIIWKHDDK